MELSALYRSFLNSNGICTDTRKLEKGQLYFALKGPNFNGNKFAQSALDAGASYAVIDEVQDSMDDHMILVEDALTTLQDLARHHRRQYEIPVLAITGSNGKTTNKELISAVLSKRYKTLFTEGNLNNHIGVPLTLLRLKPDDEFAVIEMGANHSGEIAELCSIAEPDHGLITSIGVAHLEGFGSMEGIKKGKKELFDHLIRTKGMCFINLQVPEVASLFGGSKELTVPFGNEKCLPYGVITSEDPFIQLSIHWRDGSVEVRSNLAGRFQSDNLLHAWAIGEYFGVPAEHIREALETYVPSNNRAQLLVIDDIHILLDAYNANPTSTKAALRSFMWSDREPKLVVLGDMLELGEASVELHQEIINLLAGEGIEQAVLIGPEYGKTKIPQKYHHFTNTKEAKIWWDQQDLKGNYILIKGSRGMALEQLVQ
ncbi:MAG: UDP-N-acetylmuramoyl-tripeptide--D-alanyl-D-alanine ligase [Bacteroidetes bacterium]|nr:UDP-N-acetylmuramoyl-tripeptide--D-alanyl-D-alanine ligase [Bacteroidota bacterium]